MEIAGTAVIGLFAYNPRPALGFLMAQQVKNLPAMKEILETLGFCPWVGKIPWRREWKPFQCSCWEKDPRSEEPEGLQSMGSQTHTHTHTHTQSLLRNSFKKDRH